MLLAVAVCVLFGSPAAGALAATGDVLASITAASPELCSTNVGLAFDGHDLVVPCVDNASGNTKLDYINPTDGSLVKTVTVPGHNGFAAIAYDAGRKDFWACEAPSGNSPSTGKKVWLINPADGTSRLQFTITDPAFADSCWDGLAYDAVDDTVWLSGDQVDSVYHYTTTGTLLHTYTGVKKLLGGFGNSGIAVGGGNLYLSDPDNDAIYSAPKDLSSSSVVATATGSHVEDMECDSNTFPGKNAMWVIGAFSRAVKALEIPAGTCGTGGRVPTHVPPPSLRRDVNAVTTSGTVKVRLPNGQIVDTSSLADIPMGSVIDATKGHVKITAAKRGGGTQTGEFFAGAFKISQDKAGVVQAALTGAFAARTAAHASKTAPKPKPRNLWANVSGSFRTRGKYGSASVRGTQWFTQDRTNGTYFKVTRGSILVRDFVRHRTVLLKAGRSYLAKKR